MDDDRKSSLPPPSGVGAFSDDIKMPDGADLMPDTIGDHKELPDGRRWLGEP